MSDVLIKNEAGTAPIAVGRTNDPIAAKDLHVTNLDPANRIALNQDYQVGNDDGTHMTGRTCTALNVDAQTATFTS